MSLVRGPRCIRRTLAMSGETLFLVRLSGIDLWLSDDDFRLLFQASARVMAGEEHAVCIDDDCPCGSHAPSLPKA